MSRNSKIISVAVSISIFVLMPQLVFAEVRCDRQGYTIETINGIFTSDSGAKENAKAVADFLGETYNGEPLSIKYLLNKTHSVLDVTDVAIQKTFEGVDMWDPDFLKILTDASAQVKTQKLLVVSHSQGNFYGNNFYKVVTDDGDVSKKSIGVYSVASPASYVAGDGRHLTSSTDKVIAFLVENVLPGGIAPTNDSIDYKWSDDSGKGHGFSEVYLKYRPAKIVEDIQWSLDKLSVDPARSENTPCINPPKELSTLVKIVRPAVYTTETVVVSGVAAATTVKNTAVGTAVGTYHLAVSTAVWTYNTSIATAVWAYNTTVAVGSAGANTAVAVASTISAGLTSLMHDTGNLAAGNSAAVILATQAQAQSPQVSPMGTTLPPATQDTPSKALSGQIRVIDPTASVQPALTPDAISTSVKPSETVIPAQKSISTESYTSGSGGSGGGGGGGSVPAIIPEVKDTEVATITATATPETTSSTAITYLSGVTPAVFASTTLLVATTTFFGLYNNSATFDRIIFELKNTTFDTATSSVLRVIAITTGENLPYSEEIVLESEGNWQYRARLTDSVSASSTPWSELSFFALATSTNATTTSQTTATSTPQAPTPATILFGQAVDTAHSQSHAGNYLIQTYIHSASDPTWDIKKINLRFNPTDDGILSVADCKLAGITFPAHGEVWNGTQNNIAGFSSNNAWVNVAVTADDTTKTCTYTANFGSLVSLSSGTDYDMVFSSGSWTGEFMQVYGSPADTAAGAFGYFQYQHNATPSLDLNVADAFYEFSTSTDQVAVQYITPLSPMNMTIGTTSLVYSGTYRDTDGIFNLLKFEIEATSTTGSMSTGMRVSIPATAGSAVPFSQAIDFVATETKGVRWRVQAWSYTYWGNSGYGTPWVGTTGDSDWQYFTFVPDPTPIMVAAAPPVVVNEVAWMGTDANANDEWVELLNTTNATIDLAGWTLRAVDEVPYLTLSGTIAPNGYYLVERGDDNAVQDISADLVIPFSGHGSGSGLSNKNGEKLELYNADVKVDETPDATNGWVAGTNGSTSGTRRSMERVASEISGATLSNWGTNNGIIKNGTDSAGNPIQGTPRSRNSVATP